ELLSRPLDDGRVIYHLEESVVHSLNQTATFIWEHLDGGHPPEEIARKMTERFRVSPERALRDVEATLKRLVELKLLK
ncbi:MAG: PqqD family protein, partial [Nitrospinota bacterium]